VDLCANQEHGYSECFPDHLDSDTWNGRVFYASALRRDIDAFVNHATEFGGKIEEAERVRHWAGARLGSCK
jgi:hypothetical protein